MNVRVRPKRPESILLRRREFRRGHARASATERPERAVASPDRPVPGGQTREQRSRERGPLQDHATYSCGCGFVFEAAVCTTVGCPHCGGTQAW